VANNGSTRDFSRAGAHGVTNENWGCLERYGGIPTSGLSSNDYYCTTSRFLDLCTLSLVIFNCCSGLRLILWLSLKERYPAVTKYHTLLAVAGFRTFFRHNWRVASVENEETARLGYEIPCLSTNLISFAELEDWMSVHNNFKKLGLRMRWFSLWLVSFMSSWRQTSREVIRMSGTRLKCTTTRF
jgi:hypothetical protein